MQPGVQSSGQIQPQMPGQQDAPHYQPQQQLPGQPQYGAPQGPPAGGPPAGSPGPQDGQPPFTGRNGQWS